MGIRYKGEAPQALPVEGATRAPIIAHGSVADKNSPCGKLQGIHKLNRSHFRFLSMPETQGRGDILTC